MGYGEALREEQLESFKLPFQTVLYSTCLLFSLSIDEGLCYLQVNVMKALRLQNLHSNYANENKTHYYSCILYYAVAPSCDISVEFFALIILYPHLLCAKVNKIQVNYRPP